MEKSFNEDELADIMSEIESLESDADEEIEMHMDSIDEQEEHYDVHPISKGSSKPTFQVPHSQMSFHIEGQMSLSLGFTISGKEVQVSVNEDGMKIVMDNGAVFHLPIDDEVKKVA